jgi:hypothetical protein
MKAYGGMEIWLQSFLSSVLGGGEWSGLRPVRFIPGDIDTRREMNCKRMT